MKHYQMHIRYITAIFLLTLSWHAQAAQCNEQEWNKALISQQSLDRKYNLLATKYNQWLPTFHASVFLHQEFSDQELEYLWNKNTDSFQQKVTQQITTAVQSRQTVSDLIQYITTIPSTVNSQIALWQELQDACHEGKSIANEIAASHYIDSNTTLKVELNDLIFLLERMRSVYDREILVLQNLNQPRS